MQYERIPGHAGGTPPPSQKRKVTAVRLGVARRASGRMREKRRGVHILIPRGGMPDRGGLGEKALNLLRDRPSALCSRNNDAGRYNAAPLLFVTRSWRGTII